MQYDHICLICVSYGDLGSFKKVSNMAIWQLRKYKRWSYAPHMNLPMQTKTGTHGIG